MAGRSLWDQLISGTGSAIADIREKLVEEPWYGRTLDVPTVELDSASHERGQIDPAKSQEPSSLDEAPNRGIER